MTFSSRLHQYLTSKLWLGRLIFPQRFLTQELHFHRCRILTMPHKHFIRCAASLLIFTYAAGVNADTLRCGTRLVNEDDLAIQVREKCGDPVSEELIGYRLGAAPPGLRGEREVKIEQWIYGPEQGYYHVIIFEAGRVRNIDNVRQ